MAVRSRPPACAALFLPRCLQPARPRAGRAPSRSRSTPPPTGRRCTSTDHSCGSSSRRADRLSATDDARIAIEELRREPAAAIFARAHAGARPTEQEALLRTVLLPSDQDRGGVRRIRLGRLSVRPRLCRVRALLFGERRSYAAVAPVVGISSPVQLDLGRGEDSSGGERRARLALARGARRSLRNSAAMPTARASSSSSRRCAPRVPSSRRTRPARSATSGVTALRLARRARRGRAGPVRAVGLAAARHPATSCPSRRRSRPSPPGWTRFARVWRPTSSRSSRRRTPTPSWGRRSTAGSCRSSRPSRSAPSSCASR